jgi:hypothetical protein
MLQRAKRISVFQEFWVLVLCKQAASVGGLFLITSVPA